MQLAEAMVKSLEQSQGYLTKALDGLTQEEAAWSPAQESNSIAFILWHVTRVEDFFVIRVIQRGVELYEAEGWREKLGTPAKDTGFDYTLEQLRAWPVPKLEIIRGYSESVRKKTLALLNSISPERLSELARPDRSPDSVGDILCRITTEIALHMGQIAYIRGIQRGLNK
ncbi:MAG: DinB family protein [Dehalococcoidia bacterium]